MAVLTREEFEQKYKRAPSSPAMTPAAVPQQPQSLGGTINNIAQGVTNFVGAKGIADEFGASIAHAFAPDHLKSQIEFPSTKQVVGSAIQTGANLIPGGGELGLTGKAVLAAKVGLGGAAGLGMDVGSQMQNGQSVSPGVGTAIGAGLPIAGAALVRPATAIVGRLFKGLGSGLSGVSGDTIDKIVNNPSAAQKASKLIEKQGNSKVLENNARTIINGVSQIKKDAGAAYSKGLDELADTDINPEHLKEGLLGALQKHGVTPGPDGKIDFSNAEFLDPRIQKKAEGIINTINSSTDLSGKGIRKLMDQVETAKFKSAPDGDRQAFNAFMGDLKNSMKEGVNKSTDKLGEINKSYASDMELTQAAQNILGKVKFKNLPEVVNAANKLEKMFAQKGIEPEVVDKFLTRAGINPSDFKTTEAVRQIGNQKDHANSKGLGVGEVMREVTSAVVTPDMVKNLSIATGVAKEKLGPILEEMKPLARNALIQALLQGNGTNAPQASQAGNNP